MSMQSYDEDLSVPRGERDDLRRRREGSRPSKGRGPKTISTADGISTSGEFAAPYHGLILKDDSLGRIAAYRFHVLDVIPFKKSIRALIEHGNRNDGDRRLQQHGLLVPEGAPRPFAADAPAAGLRIPLRVQVPNGALEAESLHPLATDLRSRSRTCRPSGPTGAD